MHGQRYRPSSLGLVNVIFHWIVFMLCLIKDCVFGSMFFDVKFTFALTVGSFSNNGFQ